jgi:Calcineurin-like phosphoesterase
VSRPVFVVGDVHGHGDVLVRLLVDAGLVDRRGRWSGRDAVLWLLGDLSDRGPDGIGTIDLVRRLERESSGGVRCLLGNHDALLLAAHRFGGEETSFPGVSFWDVWRVNGGVEADLRALQPEHVAWISARPALARDGDLLLQHADTDAYLELGETVAGVNRSVSATLRDGSVDAMDVLVEALSDRMRLVDPDRVDALLGRFGGELIVHGHTPIASVRGVDPGEVTGPLVYGNGRVVNVDHCLFAGGPGFVFRADRVLRGAVSAS